MLDTPDWASTPANKLLTRDKFREYVLARNAGKCVMCEEKAVDAHHILERRLWPDGGYYLANGAAVCERHHLACEMTTISVEQVREAAGIKMELLPPHLYRDQRYDKWGNPILTNGTRLKGDLFFDESVQKILGEGGVLSLFSTHVKFPRTFHLPWSPGLTKDDRKMTNEDPFKGQLVVATVKMDGENTTMYRDGIHARSLIYEPHPSRNWVKTLHASIAHEIPEGWRICGENLWAEHSIPYKNLSSYFQVFSVWDERNNALNWEDTKMWADLLGLTTVPELYKGPGDREFIEGLWSKEYRGDLMEGYVVRLQSGFNYSTYRTSVGKYVRKGHVGTHGHWMRQAVKPNVVVP